MTNLISGSTYLTSNLYFIQDWEIEIWLRDNEDSDDDKGSDMVKVMKIKFDKYWESYSDILAIADVLDPRLKFACLEYCFKKLDSSISTAKLAHVRSKMFKLFGDYKRDTSNSTTATSQLVETSREDIPSGYYVSVFTFRDGYDFV